MPSPARLLMSVCTQVEQAGTGMQGHWQLVDMVCLVSVEAHRHARHGMQLWLSSLQLCTTQDHPMASTRPGRVAHPSLTHLGQHQGGSVAQLRVYSNHLTISELVLACRWRMRCVHTHKAQPQVVSLHQHSRLQVRWRCNAAAGAGTGRSSYSCVGHGMRQSLAHHRKMGRWQGRA
jgi:hypothetical protein